MEIMESRFFKIVEISNRKDEGIVILGAGGDPQDWIKGICEMWKKEDITPNDSPEYNFSEVHLLISTGGRRDLAMIFKKDAALNIGRMAMWRLRMGDCSWVSDFVVNYKKHYTEPVIPGCEE